MRWVAGAALVAALSAIVASRVLDRAEVRGARSESAQGIDGTWLGVEKVENGLLLPPHRARTTEIRIEESRVTVLESDSVPVIGTFEILPDRDPPGIKIIVESPEEMAGTEVRANFRLEGDVLTLVTAESRTWPRGLSAEYGTMQNRTVLQRQPREREERAP